MYVSLSMIAISLMLLHIIRGNAKKTAKNCALKIAICTVVILLEITLSVMKIGDKAIWLNVTVIAIQAILLVFDILELVQFKEANNFNAEKYKAPVNITVKMTSDNINDDIIV